jgi:hypothetical protein
VHELSLAHSLGKELILSLDGTVPGGVYEANQILDFRGFDALEFGRRVPVLLEAFVARCGRPPMWSDLAEMINAVEDAELTKYRFGNIEVPATGPSRDTTGNLPDRGG